MESTITARGGPQRDFPGLPEHGGGLVKRAHLEHPGLALDEREIGARQQSAADLGIAARLVGDDEIGLGSKLRQVLQHRIRCVELDCRTSGAASASHCDDECCASQSVRITRCPCSAS
jgi:hypothetical protein